MILAYSGPMPAENKDPMSWLDATEELLNESSESIAAAIEWLEKDIPDYRQPTTQRIQAMADADLTSDYYENVRESTDEELERPSRTPERHAHMPRRTESATRRTLNNYHPYHSGIFSDGLIQRLITGANQRYTIDIESPYTYHREIAEEFSRHLRRRIGEVCIGGPKDETLLSREDTESYDGMSCFVVADPYQVIEYIDGSWRVEEVTIRSSTSTYRRRTAVAAGCRLYYWAHESINDSEAQRRFTGWLNQCVARLLRE